MIDSSTLARPTESKLPLNRIGNDSIIVDVAFIPLDGPKEIEQLWKAVDETGIPVSARGQLQANGLRAGRLIGQPLDYFNALQESDQPSSPMEALNKAGLASVLSHEQRRMHCHTNQSYSLPTRMAMEGTHSVLLERDGLLTGNR